MSEHTFQLILVWTMLASTIGQATIHLTTWWALGPQDDDPIGTALRRRELSLGAKALSRIFFELLLAWIITTDDWPMGRAQREVVYVATAIASVFALVYGGIFIWTLYTHNWGRPTITRATESKDARDERQDAQQVILDETSKVNAEAGYINADRGIHLSEEYALIEKSRLNLAKEKLATAWEDHDRRDRDRDADQREHDLKERERDANT